MRQVWIRLISSVHFFASPALRRSPTSVTRAWPEKCAIFAGGTSASHCSVGPRLRSGFRDAEPGNYDVECDYRTGFTPRTDGLSDSSLKNQRARGPPPPPPDSCELISLGEIGGDNPD